MAKSMEVEATASTTPRRTADKIEIWAELRSASGKLVPKMCSMEHLLADKGEHMELIPCFDSIQAVRGFQIIAWEGQFSRDSLDSLVTQGQGSKSYHITKSPIDHSLASG